MMSDPWRNDLPFYGRVRLVRGGAFVACRLWAEGAVDQDGRPIEDVRYRVEINGDIVSDDPLRVPFWPWEPVDEIEWQYLRDDAEWCRQHAPHDPRANPRRPITTDQCEMF